MFETLCVCVCVCVCVCKREREHLCATDESYQNTTHFPTPSIHIQPPTLTPPPHPHPPTQAALADAGDTLEDANFEEKTADSAILRLTKELAWIEETQAAEGMRDEPPSTFLDRVFENAIHTAVHETKKAYDSMMFRYDVWVVVVSKGGGGAGWYVCIPTTTYTHIHSHIVNTHPPTHTRTERHSSWVGMTYKVHVTPTDTQWVRKE